MTQLTLILSWLLIFIGVVGYFGTGMVSITALIPAFFGLPLLLLNLVARKAASPKTYILAAAILSGLGLVGSVRGVIWLVSGSFSAAVVMQAAMCLICAAYLFLAIRSLQDLRKKTSAEPLGNQQP